MEPQTETPTDEKLKGQELVRPLDGRMVAGVAVGLARRFDQPEWATRVLFVVLTAFGGLGVVLYLAGWVLIRSEEEAEPPAARFFSRAGSARSWVGIGLIFVAALIILDRITFLSSGVMWAGALFVLGMLLYIGVIPVPGDTGTRQARPHASHPDPTRPSMVSEEAPAPVPAQPTGPPRPTPTPPMLPPAASVPKERSILGRLTIGLMLLGVGFLAVLDVMPGVAIDARPRHYMALATVVLGVGLLVGSLWGRARWLILVGIILVPTLLFSPLLERDWGSVRWNTWVSPATFEEVPSSYEIEVGRLNIDLTQLPWDGEEITLSARGNMGRIAIWLPHDVGIRGQLGVDLGQVRSSRSGTVAAGIGSPTISVDEPGDSGVVNLDARLDVGIIDLYDVVRLGG